MANDDVVIKFTRQEAKELGLLICTCGWPENNHFAFEERKCAHSHLCKGYKEVPKRGKFVKEQK